MKPSRVNRAVSRVRIAGKHPVHTERETFRACVMQTAIPEDGRCCFCSSLPCHLPCVITTSFTAMPYKGYCATFLVYLCRRDIETIERISGVGCCTKVLIYLVENGLCSVS